MGKFKKENNKLRNRRFGQPCGRHSLSAKNREKALLLKKQQTIRMYREEDRRYYQPYQLVRKESRNSIATKFVVRRIPIMKERHSKLLSLGKTSLKFKMLKQTKPIAGYRVINLDCLKEHVVTITTHSSLCQHAIELATSGNPPISLKTEKCQNGLFSVMLAVCNGCGKSFPLETSRKQESGLYDINVRAVWGTMASGGGASDLREQLSTMDVPPMTTNMFSSLEQKIGQWWEEALKEETAKAGAEERRIAIEKGNLHEGIPAITVICDGGWSKRTHKHTYNAYGGVGVIFGAETKQLLYIGVRNKYCILCIQAKNKLQEPKEHNCFKNWNASSQAMEADIILTGFLEAESAHGLRYTQIIADGDSSVYPLLMENVPVWGRSITKLECANHTCKCLRSNLEKLVTEKPQYKGKGKLTKVNRVRLTTAVRCAIRMRSADKNVKQLRKDIINSVYHVLGFHERCSDFCQKRTKNTVNHDEDDHEADLSSESFDDIFESQYEYWKLPSEKEMESSRHAGQSKCSKQELKEMFVEQCLKKKGNAVKVTSRKQDKAGDTSALNTLTTSINYDSQKPGPSCVNTSDLSVAQPTCSKKRSSRSKTVKFVGREILREWITDEKKKKSKWYSGTVLDVISGKDGDPLAVYEVLYKGEETAHEVDGLISDLQDGSLKFLDI